MTTSKKRKSSERDPLDALYRKRDKAIERLLAAWVKSGETGDDPEDEVNTALDALTIVHVAATLEWSSGPHKW